MEQDEFSAIEPRTEVVTLADKSEILIKPMNISQIAKVGRALKAGELLDKAGAVFGERKEGEPFDMYQAIPFILDNADRLIEAVAHGSGMASKQVADLMPDDFVALAGAVFTVNADFFVRRLLPTVEKVAGGAASALSMSATNGKYGPTLLPTLSPAAIA